MSFLEIHGLSEFGTGSEYLIIFILTISILWITLILYSLKKNHVRKTLRYFVPMMIAALFLEASAAASGRYIYPGYLIYFSVISGTVPLIILLGWSTNLFIFLNIGERIGNTLFKKLTMFRIIAISFLAGIFGVCFDLLEDPIAHHNHWWVWTESTTNSSFYGVPFTNFLDWFLILFFMALATQLINRSSLSENRKLFISIISVSYIGAAIFLVHHGIVQLLSF
ncbi:MAG: carotenoid biosynthesis protein [Euryarchaeota archaeon]|nr:carotenoid biosynthesis protein [Euryarchaeota archaeon]